MTNFEPTKILSHSEGRVEFDDNSQTFMIVEKSNFRDKKYMFRYDQIKDVRLLTDETSHASVNLGNAIIGHALFGDTGGAIGAFTNMHTKTECSSMQLKITLKNSDTPYAYIVLLDKKVSTGSRVYKQAYNTADAIYGQLRLSVELCNKSELEKKQKEQARQEEESRKNSEEFQKYYEKSLKEIEQRRIEREQRRIEREQRKAEQERLEREPELLSAADEILKFKQLLDAGIISEEEFQAKKKQLLDL